MRRSRLMAVGVLLVCSAVVVGACSSSEDPDASEDGAGLATNSTDPEVTVPDDAAPDGVSPDSSDPDSPDTTVVDSNPSDAAYVSEVYTDPATWICRPDLEVNPCHNDMDVTVIQEDGSIEVVEHTVAANPTYDCFYIYPTVNLGAAGNVPFDDPHVLEVPVTRAQAGRLSSVCNVYAPIYRQVSMGTFTDGGDPTPYFEVAYGDVADAFLHYLANDNDGRPYILLGHSQGAGMLSQLIAAEIDDDDDRRAQMVSAWLLGGEVVVPEGADVGGDFDNVPACRADDEVGCVVTFASFDLESPPPADSLFARPRDAEGRVLCTNPAALAGGPADLNAVLPATDDPFVLGSPDVPVITTSWIATPGLFTGECVSNGEFDYLQVTINEGDGPRKDTVSNGLPANWGLHALDFNLVMGDLVTLAEAQSSAWFAQN